MWSDGWHGEGRKIGGGFRRPSSKVEMVRTHGESSMTSICTSRSSKNMMQMEMPKWLRTLMMEVNAH